VEAWSTRKEARLTASPDDRDDEPVGADDPTFDALLAQVAHAPAVRAERLLARGERAGEHEILDVIGQGAFGTVYRAVHPVLHREVAIKVLGSAHSADPGVAQRFVEEARVIHRIRHPNIVDLLGFGELSTGQMYYAMELLAGKTLAGHLTERGAFEPGVALHVLRQIADALDAAHGNGVLHRDLKPDNVFVVGELGPGCRVKLLDFGIAKLLGDDSVLRTRSGMLMGTPAYMSPEQCGGEKVDAKSDIYALGVIAHELFTGARPYPGQTVRELLSQHMFETPIRASSVKPSLPARLDGVLLALLDKQPPRRPASATAAVQALGDALSGSGSIRGLSSVITLAPSAPRLSRIWWAVASLALLAALWSTHRLLTAAAPAEPGTTRASIVPAVEPARSPAVAPKPQALPEPVTLTPIGASPASSGTAESSAAKGASAPTPSAATPAATRPTPATRPRPRPPRTGSDPSKRGDLEF
jgi:serine/threonine protein kinase